MKADEDVKMISAEAPFIFAKACEMLILDLTLRSWYNPEENKRRILRRADVRSAIAKIEIFDFLVDAIPKDEVRNEPPFTLPKHVFSPTVDHSIVQVVLVVLIIIIIICLLLLLLEHNILGFLECLQLLVGNYLMNNKNMVDRDMYRRHIPYTAPMLLQVLQALAQALWYHKAHQAEEEQQQLLPPPMPPTLVQALWYYQAHQAEERQQVTLLPPQSSSDS
ncbi:hypothetical protein M9H77_27711 [Catharanthus roseus]|uniref:Uncharacterized protein n=1 Tax=Catharanthus roseus TaxID=4058 RepID=A0ACC0ADA6_CATRO|nr:hypothetical protein M9H77_27711 [Catharanthus roseus]